MRVNCHLTVYRTTSIACWNGLGAILRAEGIKINLYSPMMGFERGFVAISFVDFDLPVAGIGIDRLEYMNFAN